MHKFEKYLFVICILLIVFIVYQMNNKTTTTMKYFPIDDIASINDAETSLQYNANEHQIDWQVNSSSSLEANLRQDVSLLYENGIFKGWQNKWKENVRTITLEKDVPLAPRALLQSISFHHGEIHANDTDGKITSMQQMTSANLYSVDDESHFHLFAEPKTKVERQWQNILSDETEQQLQSHWNSLIDHYELSLNDYDLIPLYELAIYHERPLPGQSLDSTATIIGQFWEGFYNNYFTLLMSYKKDIPAHYMPVILFAKDKTHLLVLYKINDEYHKLIQQIHSPNN